MRSLGADVAQLGKAVAQPTRIWARRATSGARGLPDFVIIGGQRCGTTAFYEDLTRHPSVLRAAGKELHFFDYHWAKGQAWYRSQFPLRWRRMAIENATGKRTVTGEATPYYMFHPRVPERAHQVVPRAKLIVLLRDPVGRAHSHYEWMRKQGNETLPLKEAISAERQRLEPELARMLSDPEYHSPAHRNFSYLGRGCYAEQLKRWLQYFPREQMLIIISEEFFSRPEDTFAQTLRFLDVADTHLVPKSPRVGQQYYSRLDQETRAVLVEYFRGPNQELTELLGRDLPW